MLKNFLNQTASLADLMPIIRIGGIALNSGVNVFGTPVEQSFRLESLETGSLDSFCRTSDGQLIVLVNYKFLSWCFINQYLVALPQALFSVFLLFRLVALLNTRRTSQTRQWDFHLKNGLMVFQFVFLLISESLKNSRLLFGVTKLSSGLVLISSFLTASVQYLELGRTIIPSDVVLWYWFTVLVTDSIKIAHIIYLGYFRTQHIASLLETFIIVSNLLIFLLEWIIPKYRLPKNIKLGEDEADAFSRASLTWTNGLFAAASRGKITSKDIPAISHKYHTKTLTEEFERVWNSNNGKGTAWTLAKVVFTLNGWRIVNLIIFELVGDILSIIEPVLLGVLINHVSLYGTENEQPLIYGVYIALLLFLAEICLVVAGIIASYNEMGLRAALKGLVYGVIFRKAIRFSPKSKEEHPTSQLMNLVSTDFMFLMQALVNTSKIVTAPFQIAFCFMALYKFVGVYMWVGVIILCILSPSSAYANSLIGSAFREYMKAKDARVKLTSSMLTNAKSLKLYAWEDAFLNLLDHARNGLELEAWKRALLVWVSVLSMWLLVPFFVTAGTFFAYGKFSGHVLNAAIIFPTLSLFNYLSKPLSALPQAVMMTIQGRVSFERLAEILSAPEKDLSKYQFSAAAKTNSDISVMVDCEEVDWSEQENSITALEKIKFSVKKNQLSCIIGRVGSGKTAFLTTICGLNHLKGDSSVIVKGCLAYVPQEPWLLNQSVRENILFGHKLDLKLYLQTLEACCLDADVAQFPDGDETEIGEKGITLSGGQKARVSLARAVYARADVYILDDVLSAVDEHVAGHIIDKVLSNEGILSSRTRILATNNIKVLHKADSIFMLENKTFVEHGSVPEVFRNGEKIGKLVKEFGSMNTAKEDTDIPTDETLEDKENDMSVHDESGHILRKASISTVEEGDEQRDEAQDRLLKKAEKSTERKKEGSVDKTIFLKYFKSSGFFLAFTSLIAITLSCVVQMISSIWLKVLSQQNLDSSSGQLTFYIGGYLFIGLMVSVFYVLAFYCMIVKAALTAAKKLHNQMMKSVLRAPMHFFESTPIGQILNRFTNDIGELDLLIPQTLFEIISIIGKTFCALLIVVFSSPLVLLVAAPLSVIYAYYQRIYVPCTRQMKRIASASWSPVLSHLEESLKGVHVISAFQMEKKFIRGNDIYTDFNLIATTLSQQIDRWLQLRLSLIGALITLTAAITGVVMARNNRMSGGLMGLMLTNAIEVSAHLSAIVNSIVSVELRGVTLERIMEFIELPSEAPSIVENNRPAATWPTEGSIKFENYSARYRKNLDLVLKDVDLRISPREKIGVVGRTGAGKSSLTLALFRLIEASSGHIDIDSIRTNEIGLNDLRRNLSIIPQDAQIFEGSVRENIDPSSDHSDTDLWQVLEICHLKAHVKAMEGELQAHLSESGGNLSRGQAQLICLARALLHPSNILVLDEATASVDVETDSIIQKAIRTEFRHKTIVTIAHRLNTIMDSDKIVVLEAGKIVEFDTPGNLLENENSFFYSLCKKGGLLSDNGTEIISSSSSTKCENDNPR